MSSRHSLRLLLAQAEAVRLALANGALYLYSGSQPAEANLAPTGTLIGIATRNAGAWTPGTATNGINFDAAVVSGDDVILNKAAAETWQFAAVAAGTIGWARFVGNPVDGFAADPTGTRARYDMAVSLPSGSGEILLSKITYGIGEPGTIQAGAITFQNALAPA